MMQRQGKLLELLICMILHTAKEVGEGKRRAVGRALQCNHVPEGDVRIATHKRMLGHKDNRSV